MTRTWLTSCIKVPGPEANLDQYPASYGVPNGGDKYGNQMQGVINHITAGHFSASNTPVDVMLGRGNSWPITIFRSGKAEQHFALEAMAWHAGADANWRYDGIEHECNTWENLTVAQLAKSIEVQSEVCRIRGWPAIVRGVTGFEHNEFMSTSCPDGKIPWAAIEEGTEDMDEATVKALIRSETPKVVFKPPGHSGASLAAWVNSYDKHRKGYGGAKLNHISTPLFIKRSGSSAVYMAVGGALFHIRSSAIRNEMYKLYGTGTTKTLPESNPIWTLPKFSIS